jgi:branched-chain amino acid transport system substrate-binding protein
VAAALFLRHQLRAKTYYLVDDGQSYGAGLASAFSGEAATLYEERVGVAHLRVSPSDAPTRQQVSSVADQIASVAPDAVYCGCDGVPASYLAHALASRGFHGAFISGDAAYNSEWLKFTGPKHGAFATDSGVGSNRAAGWFHRAFTARFHAATQLYDAYAYDAATAVLRAVVSAATQGRFSGSITQRRRAVVISVTRTCFHGASGPVSFDRNGDTINRSVSVYADQLGSWHLRTVVAVGHPPHCT